jgi:hypothetical protein
MFGLGKMMEPWRRAWFVGTEALRFYRRILFSHWRNDDPKEEKRIAWGWDFPGPCVILPIQLGSISEQQAREREKWTMEEAITQVIPQNKQEDLVLPVVGISIVVFDPKEQI